MYTITIVQVKDKIKARLKELDKKRLFVELTPKEKRERGKLMKAMLETRYVTPSKQ